MFFIISLLSEVNIYLYLIQEKPAVVVQLTLGSRIFSRYNSVMSTGSKSKRKSKRKSKGHDNLACNRFGSCWLTVHWPELVNLLSFNSIKGCTIEIHMLWVLPISADPCFAKTSYIDDISDIEDICVGLLQIRVEGGRIRVFRNYIRNYIAYLKIGNISKMKAQ